MNINYLVQNLVQKQNDKQKSLINQGFSCWFRCPLHGFVRTFHIENKQKCWNIADFREILLGIFNVRIKNGAKVGQKQINEKNIEFVHQVNDKLQE